MNNFLKLMKMFAVMSENKCIINENGEMLVANPKTQSKFWVPANEVHQISEETLELESRSTNITSPNSDLSPVTEPATEESEENENKAEEKTGWSHEQTLLLIQLYEKYENSFQKMLKKHVWQKITRQMNATTSKTFTEVNVENQWKALKRTYKNLILRHSQSGQKRKYWEYFQIMDEVMKKKPEINPLVTASSSSGVVVHTNPKEPDTESADTNCYATLNKSKTDCSEEKGSFKRKAGPNVNDRHKEKMARQDRFLELFEKMVDNM